MRNCTHFNAKLRELMEENHLSVRKLADLSGLSPSTIQRLRSQPDVPHMDTIEALADAFCIDPKVLILADAEDARELDWAVEDAMRAQEGNKASSKSKPAQKTIPQNGIPLLDFRDIDANGKPSNKGDYVRWPIHHDYSCLASHAAYAWTDSCAPEIHAGDLLFIDYEPSGDFFIKVHTPMSGNLAIGIDKAQRYLIGRLLVAGHAQFLVPTNSALPDTKAQPVEKVVGSILAVFRKYRFTA